MLSKHDNKVALRSQNVCCKGIVTLLYSCGSYTLLGLAVQIRLAIDMSSSLFSIDACKILR